MLAHFGFWIIAFVYCAITFMVAVLAWSRGYNIGKSEGFRRGFHIGRTRTRDELRVAHGH